MTVVEKIIRELNSIPAEAQKEVLEFVEYIKLKTRRQGDLSAWSHFALQTAMRGMEAELELYSLEDLQEKF